jgi:alkylation response protein AidB-like acyl-CoA dehydrogenase
MAKSAVEQIWASDPRAFVANGLPADARATPVPDGYLVDGRFVFSSGCRHATWLAAGAQVVEAGVDGGGDLQFFFFPKEKATLIDAWDVNGLRATGTDQFSVSQLFVPKELSAPSTMCVTSAVRATYGIPIILYFGMGLAAVGLGIARAALDDFVVIARQRTPSLAKQRLADQTLVQLEVGKAETLLRAAKAFLTSTVVEARRAAQAERAIPPEARAALRLACTNAMHRSAEVVDIVYSLLGSASIFAESSIQRCFQDIHVLTQHIQARPAHLASAAAILMGLESEAPFI